MDVESEEEGDRPFPTKTFCFTLSCIYVFLTPTGVHLLVAEIEMDRRKENVCIEIKRKPKGKDAQNNDDNECKKKMNTQKKTIKVVIEMMKELKAKDQQKKSVKIDGDETLTRKMSFCYLERTF